jgi:tRNA threonylcarbamoyladenosine biosynthesis protein TsaB
VLILSLDTTTRAGSVAIVADGATVYEQTGDASSTHAQRLPGEIERACRAASIDIAQVDLFAVAAGPGSFTGLRIGIAAVQGLAMAWARRVVPVSTLEALAAASGAPCAAAWLDAQRGEVFAQVFEQRSGVTYEARNAAVSAAPDAVLELQAGHLDGAVFHGDGALKFRDAIRARLGGAVAIVDPVRPLAGANARHAHERPERAVAPQAIMPISVRGPDAEVARDRRARGSGA